MIIRKYIHTLKYLKLRQIVFLIARKFNLKRFILNPIDLDLKKNKSKSRFLRIARSGCNNINLKHSFTEILDGMVEQKLFLYNIFYLNDYSDQRYLHFHLQCYATKSIFLEPYPTSLRLVNLLYYSDLTDEDVTRCLETDVKNLSLNIEYELDGNHLLENFLALSLFELVFLEGRKYTQKFGRLLEAQFVDSQWHFEQSPMYQAILLERLQCYLAVTSMFDAPDNPVIALVKQILVKGVGYMALFHVNGVMLNFNDSTGGNSLSIEHLVNNNKLLNLECPEKVSSFELIKNGFARIENAKHVVVVDASKVLADHIPGHIHSATGTFWLFRDGKPFVVNNAISTYQENSTRTLERGSSFHNCIVPKVEFNEVWGCFRVARRVYSKIHGGENSIALNAKLLTGQTYSRSFSLGEYLTITDRLDDSEEKITACIYFDPSVSPSLIVKHVHSTSIYCIDVVDIPVEFNKLVTSHFIYYKFSGSNIVSIQ